MVFSITDRLELKRKLNCKSFDWLLQEIYPELDMHVELQNAETKASIDDQQISAYLESESGHKMIRQYLESDVGQNVLRNFLEGEIGRQLVQENQADNLQCHSRNTTEL